MFDRHKVYAQWHTPTDISATQAQLGLAIAAAVMINLYVLKIVSYMYRHRTSLLVRARGAHLAVLQGLSLLATADALLIQLLLAMAGQSHTSNCRPVNLLLYLLASSNTLLLPLR